LKIDLSVLPSVRGSDVILVVLKNLTDECKGYCPSAYLGFPNERRVIS
jgi:hypothetical protein